MALYNLGSVEGINAGAQSPIDWNLAYNPNLVMILGQSNAAGAALISEMSSDLTGPMSGVLIFNHINNQWEVMEPGVNSRGTTGLSGSGASDANAGAYGPEARLMKSIKAASSSTQYIMKYCVSNTPLAANGSFLDWSTSTNELLPRSLSAFIRGQQSSGDKRPPKCIFWIQGENDANATDGPNYETNLTAFVAAIRTQYSWASLPFIIVRMGDQQTSFNSTNRGFIRTAQQNVVAINTSINKLVDADSIATYDGTHYPGGLASGGGVETLGARMYTAYQAL
jgi:hypothetical protein